MKAEVERGTRDVLKIVLAHLREDPAYYRKLARMEATAPTRKTKVLKGIVVRVVLRKGWVQPQLDLFGGAPPEARPRKRAAAPKRVTNQPNHRAISRDWHARVKEINRAMNGLAHLGYDPEKIAPSMVHFAVRNANWDIAEKHGIEMTREEKFGRAVLRGVRFPAKKGVSASRQLALPLDPMPRRSGWNSHTWKHKADYVPNHYGEKHPGTLSFDEYSQRHASTIRAARNPDGAAKSWHRLWVEDAMDRGFKLHADSLRRYPRTTAGITKAHVRGHWRTVHGPEKRRVWVREHTDKRQRAPEEGGTDDDEDEIEKALLVRLVLRKGKFADIAGRHSGGTPIDKRNFHEDTKAAWRPAKAPKRDPDHVSKSGSRYWHGKHGVYREADHWSNDTVGRRSGKRMVAEELGELGRGLNNDIGCRWDHAQPHHSEKRGADRPRRVGYVRYREMEPHPKARWKYGWLRENRPEVADTWKAVTLNRRTGRMSGAPTYVKEGPAWDRFVYSGDRLAARIPVVGPAMSYSRRARKHIAGLRADVKAQRADLASAGGVRGGRSAAMLAQGHQRIQTAKQPTSTAAKPAKTAEPPGLGADVLHAAAANYGLTHAASRDRKGGWLGRKSDGQEHLYHHKTPYRSAQTLRSALGGANTVSGIRQKRVLTQGGRIRHAYTFHVAPAGGGPGHYVTVMRGGA